MRETAAPLNVIEYEVRAVDGTLTAVHQRREFSDFKTFTWIQPDGRTNLNGAGPVSALPLYRSDRMNVASEHAIDGGNGIILVEGEKAADTLAEKGYTVVATYGASVTPDLSVLETLRGRDVYLWPDNDDPGQQHMQRVAANLHKLGIGCYIMDVSGLPQKSDAADVPHVETVDQLLDTAEMYYSEQQGDEPKVWNAHELRRMYSDEITTLYEQQQEGRRRNLQWGFERLDDLTDGIYPGLITLHALPGIGKSAFVLQIAQQCDAPVLYVTAEMSVREMMRRTVARMTRTPRRELLVGRLDPQQERELMLRAVDLAPRVTYLDGTNTPVKPPAIREQVGLLKQQDKDGHALVVIDSLHSWAMALTEDMPDVSEYGLINEAIVALRKISSRHKVPVIIVAERNRAAMRDSAVIGAAVAGSRAPEYRSDVVLALDREESDDDDRELQKLIKLTVTKNRNGPPGSTISYTFDGDLQHWQEMV